MALAKTKLEAIEEQLEKATEELSALESLHDEDAEACQINVEQAMARWRAVQVSLETVLDTIRPKKKSSA